MWDSKKIEVSQPPVVRLSDGHDSNAFAILGTCRRSEKAAGWSEEKWEQVKKEMMSGDHDHLLQTVFKHFDVE